MKTNFVRHCTLGLVASLTFFLGCARPSAQPEQVVAPATTSAVVVAEPLPASGPTNTAPLADLDTSSDTNAPAIVERIPATARPESVALSPGLSEVVKLAQAGVGEEVILAFVDKYSGRFGVGADQILYLNDLGVPGTVITSLLKHDGVMDVKAADLNAADPKVTVAAVATNASPLMPAQPGEEPVPAQVATSVAPPPTSTEVSYFYDSLSPYGSWIYLSGYGWCWQPTVAVSVSTWRPYCDRGRWYWSDAGWYWNSDYSWGWATFHYGRWYRHPGCGWVWTPGTVWAPSWVSWRYYDGYCGWAPLPPAAHFAPGIGFTYHGSHVSVGFDFGLHYSHYSFVHINNFCDYSPYRYVVPHTQVQNFYRNTTVINNYVVGNNNTVINRGLGRDTIARASTTRLREVSVRETPVQNLSRVRGDRIERQGNQTVVYRPQLPKTPPTVRTAQFVNRGGQAQGSATVARGSTGAAAARDGAGANVAASPSRAGNGRVQTAPRASTSENVQTTVPQSRSGERPGGSTAAPRGNVNAPAGGSSGRNSQPSSAPRGRPQSRVNAPLFGSDTAGNVSSAPPTQVAPQPQNDAPTRNASPAGNGVAARPQQQGAPNRAVAAPAARPQQNNSTVSAPAARAYQNNVFGAPGVRVYPQGHAQTQTQQPARSETRTVVRGQTDHSTMSPRGYEQAPRYNVPGRQAAPSAPAAQGRHSAPQYSAPPPAARSSGASSVGRSERAPVRAERF